jgi:hypothetical protein
MNLDLPVFCPLAAAEQCHIAGGAETPPLVETTMITPLVTAIHWYLYNSPWSK